MYLIFNTLGEAEIANNEISENMNLNSNITITWDIPILLDNGKYAIKKPEDLFLNNITDFPQIEDINQLIQNPI